MNDGTIEFNLPDEDRWIDCNKLPSCPRCGCRAWMQRTMTLRNKVYVASYQIVCECPECRLMIPVQNDCYSSEEARRAWNAYARLAADT